MSSLLRIPYTSVFSILKVLRQCDHAMCYLCILVKKNLFSPEYELRRERLFWWCLLTYSLIFSTWSSLFGSTSTTQTSPSTTKSSISSLSMLWVDQYRWFDFSFFQIHDFIYLRIGDIKWKLFICSRESVVSSHV